MLIRFYDFEHALDLLGFHEGLHFYDIPSIAVIVLLIVMGLVHWRKHKKRQKEMEEELEERLEQKRQRFGEDGVNGFREYQ